MRPKVTPIETKKLREDDGGGRIVLNKTESSKALWFAMFVLALLWSLNFALIQSHEKMHTDELRKELEDARGSLQDNH